VPDLVEACAHLCSRVADCAPTRQAYLETDPADRSSGKGAIQLRYQAMAYQELQRALAQFSAAEQRLGPRPPASALGGCCPASWSALPSLILMSSSARPGRAELLGASKGLAVTLADSLLARDKLEAALRCVPRVDCPRCATYQAGASCELAHPAGCRRGEAAERDKRLVGLRRENLTFCGDG